MKFVARQPILDRNRQLFAYELLFRSGARKSCESPNLEEASLSMIDTSFLIVIQEEMPARTDIKEALLEQPVPYRDVLELVIALERGNWDKVSAIAPALKMTEEQPSELYLSAVEWSNALRSEPRQPVVAR